MCLKLSLICKRIFIASDFAIENSQPGVEIDKSQFPCNQME